MDANPTAAFQRLVAVYYRAWLRFHPEIAVDAGVPGYEWLLPPHGDDDIGALLALNDELLEALDEVDLGALDLDARLDWTVLAGAATLENHRLREHDWRHRDPLAYLPVHAIYQLTVRPVTGFPAALAARLARIPAHLRSARAELRSEPEAIPALWLEDAVAECVHGAQYLRGLHAHPALAGAGVEAGPLHALLDEAAHALELFGQFLENDLGRRAQGSPAAGADLFGAWLRYRHHLDVGPDALHRFGTELFARTQAELTAAVRELRGDDDVAGALAALRADAVPRERLVEAFRHEMQQARAFVRARGLVPLPPVEHLVVEETPAFLRHRIPFAAYLDPSPADPQQTGRYYVTLPPPGEPSRAPRLGVAHTSVHEAWPGHHLQFALANAQPAARSLPRLCNPSATLYEGWALYCEELMVEQGLLAAPEQRVLMLHDRLWRALRIQLDVELHARGVAPEAAAARMSAALGFSPRQARGEIGWYSRAPTVPLGYATGWALIRAARAAAGLPLADFHRRLLAPGSIALPLVLDAAFGAGSADRARDRVFDPNRG